MKIISICFSLIFLATNCFGFISRYHDPLDLRVVDQGETTRLVFEWIGDTNYSVESTNNTIMIRFNRAVPFNKNTIATKLPRRLHLEGVTNQNNQMVFTFLAYPNGQEFITTRHYKQGFKIVLDIVFENKANARPLIHTGTKNPNSTLKRLDRLEAPKIQPLQNLPKIRYMKKDNIQEIFVPLKTSLKPIIYQRGNFLWLVVDALQKWDLSALANNYTPKLFNQDKITALMLNSPNKIMPKIIYEKTGIKLVFNDAKQNDETQENLSLKVHSDPVIDSTIDIDLGNKATPISPIQFKDPVTADTLFLVPTPAHITSPQEQKFVDFRLLKTSAGLSLLPP
jgi:hypothetical protein